MYDLRLLLILAVIALVMGGKAQAASLPEFNTDLLEKNTAVVSIRNPSTGEWCLGGFDSGFNIKSAICLNVFGIDSPCFSPLYDGSLFVSFPD